MLNKIDIPGTTITLEIVEQTCVLISNQKDKWDKVKVGNEVLL
nr:MAG TPA: hypothetical protein [Caudoviricetes sp.]